MRDRAEFSGDVKWTHSAITTSLAAAAHEDYLIRPAAGRKGHLQALGFQATGPAGAGSGTHEMHIYLTDGTNEIELWDTSEAFGAGLNNQGDNSSDATARPDVLDRPLLNILQNIILTNDIYMIVRYLNDTDVATTRARNVDICYREI